MNILKQLGMTEMAKHSERLNAYLKSVDEDLKNLILTFNENTSKIQRRLDQIDAKLTSMDSRQQK